MAEIELVTAFFDVKRKWGEKARTSLQYIEYFKFWARIKNRLVVYTDKETAEKVSAIRKSFGLEERTHIVVIDDIKMLDKEVYQRIKKIFETDDIINFRNHLERPESHNPDYNYITYLKPYFVTDAINKGLVSGMISWVDFGYNHGGEVYTNPEEFSFLWEYSFSKNRIHLFLLNEINTLPVFRIIKEMPTDMTAGIIVAPDYMWSKLVGMFRSSLLQLIHCGLVDDEQTLLIMAYREFPDLFEVHYMNNWCKVWKDFGGGHLSISNKIEYRIKYKKDQKDMKKYFGQRKYFNAIEAMIKYIKGKILYKTIDVSLWGRDK